MEKSVILSVYEKVSGVMGLMVQAAEEKDWDRLIELETHCSSYMDTLRFGDHHDDLTVEELQYKMDLIRKILNDDRKIREQTEPWMKELSDLIRHSSTARKINHAYGSSNIS